MTHHIYLMVIRHGSNLQFFIHLWPKIEPFYLWTTPKGLTYTHTNWSIIIKIHQKYFNIFIYWQSSSFIVVFGRRFSAQITIVLFVICNKNNNNEKDWNVISNIFMVHRCHSVAPLNRNDLIKYVPDKYNERLVF